MLHFAYGSNMHRAVMRRHAPSAMPVGVATLMHHRFLITADGYASVEPARGETVHGVLWRIAPRDRVTLDAWENIAGAMYRAEIVPVRHAGRLHRSLIYFARPGREGRPKAGYMELVIAAAREWQFPDAYIASLQRWLPGAAAWRGTAQARGLCMDVSKHVIIRGRVQGVGFRAWTEYTALERGVQGWVRNRRDGAVEALFIGPPDVVAAMIAACNEGPRGARVDAIDQRDGTRNEAALRRAGDLFSLLPTS